MALYATRGLRVGIDTTPGELPGMIITFPGLGVARVYAKPGAGIPRWAGGPMRLLHLAGVLAWPSFKDWPDDQAGTALVDAWCATLPADVPEVWLTLHHEPEGDLSPALYRHQWEVFASAARTSPAGPRLRLVPIHSLYPALHPGTRLGRERGQWQSWAPRDRQQRYLGDYMGWDCYLAAEATRYPLPEVFFAVPVAAAKEAGVPLVVPELGALRVVGDNTGNGRAAWITDCLTYLREVDARAVAWWQSTGANGRDYRLHDAPSAAAWHHGVQCARAMRAAPPTLDGPVDDGDEAGDEE
jgi:hypothetical protein